MTRLPGLLAAAMLLLTLAALPASGESQYQIFVFEENQEYQIGDTVRLEIHFFDRENYINAAEINLSAGYDGPYIEVDETAARQATGVYEVSFVLAEEHAPYGIPQLRLVITGYAVAGSDNPDDRAEESVWLRMVGDEEATDFDITVEADPLEPRPGDSVSFTVSFTNFSTPVDPPETDIEAVFEAFDGEEEAVNLTRQSTGVYTYSYTVPADQAVGGEIRLEVKWVYGGEYDYEWGGVSLGVHFYDLWLHTLEFTGSTYRGEVYVSDLDGKAVAGTEVNSLYRYNDFLPVEPRGWSNGTTDASGKVVLDLVLLDFDRGALRFQIELNGTYQDRMDGVVYYPDEEDDDDFVPDEPNEGWGFQIVAQQDPWDRLAPDADVELTFRAYNDTEPLTGAELYVYVVNGAYDLTEPLLPAVIVHEKVTTNTTGNFTLAFRTPAECGQLRVIVKAYLPGVEWDDTNYTSDSDYLYMSCGDGELIDDPSILLEVTNFGLGQRATLTASKGGLGEAFAFFNIIPIGEYKSIDPDEDADETEWQRLSGALFGSGVFRELEGGSATTEFLLPEFLPAENYLVMVVIYTDDGNYMNYVILDSTGKQVGGPDTGGGEDDDDDGFLPGPGLLLAGVALMAVAVRQRRRR